MATLTLFELKGTKSAFSNNAASNSTSGRWSTSKTAAYFANQVPESRWIKMTAYYIVTTCNVGSGMTMYGMHAANTSGYAANGTVVASRTSKGTASKVFSGASAIKKEIGNCVGQYFYSRHSNASGSVSSWTIRYVLEYQGAENANPPEAENMSLSATRTNNNQVTLSWAGVVQAENNPIAGYRVRYGTEGNWQTIDIETTDQGATATIPVPETPGAHHDINVMTLGTVEGLDSAWSATFTVYRDAAPVWPEGAGFIQQPPSIVFDNSPFVFEWTSPVDAITGEPVTECYCQIIGSVGDEQRHRASRWGSNSASFTFTHTHGETFIAHVYAYSGFGLQSEPLTCEEFRFCKNPSTPIIMTPVPSLVEPSTEIPITLHLLSSDTDIVACITNNGTIPVEPPSKDVIINDVRQTDGLTRGKQYTFMSKAIDSYGYTSESAIVYVRINDYPQRPQNVRIGPDVFESNVLNFYCEINDIEGDIDRTDVLYGDEVLTSFTDVGTVYGHVTIPEIPRGERIRLTFRTYDTFGLYTESVSNYITRNMQPNAPTIVVPAMDGAIMCGQIVTAHSNDPEGQRVTLLARIDNQQGWTVLGDSIGGDVTGSISVGPGAHILHVKAVDELGAFSEETIRTYEHPSSLPIRQIDPGDIIADENTSHQDDIHELYRLVNQRLAAYGKQMLAVPQDIGYFSRWRPQMKELFNALKGCGSQVKSLPETDYPTAEIINIICGMLLEV